LDDSLPSVLLRQWQEELALEKAPLSGKPSGQRVVERHYNRRVENYLDKNRGSCLLREPGIASMIADALRFFSGQRYVLYAWTVMPNHLHGLFQPLNGYSVSSVVHSWKSYTAHRANEILRRSGRFWQPEYFDTLIKSERHFEFCFRYILNNPVRAGLCKNVYQWLWSGCSADMQLLVNRFFGKVGLTGKFVDL
jgi:REP element-mobilizing transposase RayT